MHILIMPSWYPSTKNPTLGVFFRDQALALRKAGHQVGVIAAPDRKEIRKLHTIKRISDLKMDCFLEIDEDVPTYRISQWSMFPRKLSKLNLSSKKRAMEKVFGEYCRRWGKPDVIHAHASIYGGYFAALIGTEWQIPAVLTEHSSGFLHRVYRLYFLRIARTAHERSAVRLAVGPQLADVLQDLCPKKPVRVLGNMVDVEFFTPGNVAIPSSPFVFSVVAILRKNKRVDILLKSMKEAFQNELLVQNNVRLVVAGDGPERVKLEQLAKDLKIERNVRFLGRLDRSDVRDLIRRSHVIVSSSLVETFGLTLVEAMACGKPVIATRSGGPEMFVNETTGLLVDPGDVDTMARAMGSILENYDDYDQLAIRKYCIARYSERAIVKQLEDIYRDVIA